MGCEWETTRASPLALRADNGRADGEIRCARVAGMEVPLRPIRWRGGSFGSGAEMALSAKYERWRRSRGFL